MIILASESPRRKELLKQAGVDFSVFAPNVDENVHESLPPKEYVSVVAMRKARAAVEKCVADGLTRAIIIAADTVVSAGEKILCKPENHEDAAYMLKLLAGRWHSVFTGFVVADISSGNTKYVQDCCETKVKFKNLTDAQIKNYIDTGEPFGKAGAYAIQGVGGELVETIDGDYNNVVGLPVSRVLEILNSLK